MIQELEKAISNLNASMEKAKNMREQQKKDYEDADADLQSGITALSGSIDQLKGAGVGINVYD